ncbi:MAG TPA: hypothetical protein PLO61_03990 [Fimbriimonadaceae bacterium]|nr:hypothetical protein [Fimbriimonadaceae bacterium]HRJ32877.1 hypothetical protein [Fimbriimonadaceae bacterium]
MNIRKIALVGLTFAAVFAMADGPTGPFVGGRGALTDADGKKARFDLQVGEKLVNGVATVRGKGEFEQRRPPANGQPGAVRVVRFRAETLSIANNVGTVGGPGVMTVRVGNQAPQNVQGTVSITATDNRAPNAQGGDPDSYTITFTGGGQNAVNFTFTGTVHPGDFRVKPAQNVP